MLATRLVMIVTQLPLDLHVLNPAKKMDCQDLEEMPKPKRPRLEDEKREEDTSTTLPESEFAISFRHFLSEHNVVVKDFEKLFHHVESVLGAETMADLEELQPDDLSEDKTGIKNLHVSHLRIICPMGEKFPTVAK